jgi:hypothetical protein
VYLKLLRLQRDIVQIGLCQVSLTNGAVPVCLEPQRDAFFAELVPAYRQDADGEGGLADDTHPLLGYAARIGFLQV